MPMHHRVLGLDARRQMVVARLRGGGLWVHSPAIVTPELRAALAELGPVRHVVGPNRWHDECLKEFQAAYPEAAFHAAPGLAGVRRDVRFAFTLSDTPDADCADEFEQHLVRGMPKMNEVVFWHRRTRSLILADVALNVGPPGTWRDRVFFGLAGAWGRFTPTRFCRSLMHDRTAVRASLTRISHWDFDRIIVGHGRNIESGGRAAFRGAFAFLE